MSFRNYILKEDQEASPRSTEADDELIEEPDDQLQQFRERQKKSLADFQKRQAIELAQFKANLAKRAATRSRIR